MNRYANRSSHPLVEAQKNLIGRTHYVDPDTLRFHKSRVLDCRIHYNGLFISIIESCAVTMDGRKRGFRYVLFDIFGNVVARPDLDDCFKSRAAATRELHKVVGSIDPVAHTKQAIDNAEKVAVMEFESMRKDLVN